MPQAESELAGWNVIEQSPNSRERPVCSDPASGTASPRDLSAADEDAAHPRTHTWKDNP